MDRELREQFFSAVMRLKKLESAFSLECDIQMNELAILQSITGACGCEECGVNLNVPEIQEKLHISKPAVSYILNTLEKKNYITREIDPKDRRKIAISATREGKEAAEQSICKRDEMWSMLLDRFGEEDMRRLIQLLTRLTDFFAEFQQSKCPERNSE